MKRRTLNLGCGVRDKWGTDRLDWETYGQKDIVKFNLNSKKKLPYKDNTFNEIKFGYVIQVLLYPQEVLEECYRILKVGGTLNITFPDYESLFYFLFPIRDHPVRFGESQLNNGKTYGIWNMNMMINRLESAGFKIKKTSKYGRAFTNLFLSNPAILIICEKEK